MTYTQRFTQWQNYAHYVLLAILMTFYYATYGDFTKSIGSMGVELVILLFVSDSLVHGLFHVLPKPYRWRD